VKTAIQLVSLATPQNVRNAGGGKNVQDVERWICKFCAEESQKISHFKYAVFCNDCLFERLEEIRRKEEERRQREIDEEYANWAK
jgi:hypothetical protein